MAVNAVVNVGRLNAFRLNYVQPALKAQRDYALSITLGGTPLRVRLDTLTIHDVINDSPNTASFVADHATPPTVGQRLRITIGIDPVYLLFAGILQKAAALPIGRASINKKEWQCEALDDTGRSDWLRPFGAWEGISATTVAQQLVASFGPGFSSAGVQAGLPPVTLYLDGTERMNGALRLLAKLIGGYYYWDDYVLHLFTGSEAGGTPDPITGAPGQILQDPPITYTSDDAQIRTRCFGKGHSEATLAAVNAGETLLPIANAVMFNPFGGKAISEWQRLQYTGTVIGGTGSLVGPGVVPSSAPVAAATAGTGVTVGSHLYAYTWVTAAGETPASPVSAAAITTALEAGPPIYALNPQPNLMNYPQPPPGTLVEYALSKLSDVGGMETPRGATKSWYSVAGQYQTISVMCTADMVGNWINCWRHDNGGAWGLIGSIKVTSQPVGGVFPFFDQYATTGNPRPDPANNYQSGRVNVSGISTGQTGGTGVTARRLYRSAANTSTPLKLLATLADNTTTTYADALGDASLGAAAPVTDTSGLQMQAGQVLPGSPTLPVAGTGWALAGGGWVVIGNGQQVIRYTGISGSTLTGIPPSGNGAITAAVNFNSSLTGAPMLTGVSGIGTAIRSGAPVNIWVQVDDTAAQAALAARVGGSGVIEHLISDERRGEQSLIALCQADLALYARPIVTVQYATFDPNTRSGKTVAITLAALGLNTTLMIQDVTIDRFQPKPTKYPRFTVTASSVRSSLEDVLRQLVGTLEEGF